MKKFVAAVISFLSLLLFPTSTYAVAPFFDVFYDATANALISIRGLPPKTPGVPLAYSLRGHMVIRNFRVGDLDGDGKQDIQTEILSMELRGNNPRVGEVLLKKAEEKEAKGMTEQLIRSSRLPVGIGGSNLPANSFFDIFVDLKIPEPPSDQSATSDSSESEDFTTEQPIRIEGVVPSLENLGGIYISKNSVLFNPKEIVITANNRGGGKIKFFAISLNSSKSN